MIAWNRHAELLLNGSHEAIRRFFAQHPGLKISAIGYTFELWNASPAFSLCANTPDYYRIAREHYRKKWPKVEEEQVRWNSGDYEYCASLTRVNELGMEWELQYVRLHDQANQDEHARDVYDGLIRISCETLAKLAKRGIFGDWEEIDFNVSEYGDDIELVKKRDRAIRYLIESGG